MMERKPGVYYSADWIAIEIRMIRWVYQPKIKTFFADFSSFTGPTHNDIRRHKELVDWCEENYCVMARGWIECPDDETATMFKLKWC